MKIKSIILKLLALFALLAIVGIVYVLFARPYQLHWGATQEEIARSMPGDELDPNPTFLATRAITIQASPEKIYPWLAQMGFKRAGFYGYDLIENIGDPNRSRSAEEIIPELQNIQTGDVVPISLAAQMVFGEIQPDRYLIWKGMDETIPGGFTWALVPVDAQSTRLVSRIRWSHHWSRPELLPLDLFTEFADHLAVRKILQGVKDRAEGRLEPYARQNLEVAVYVLSAILFFIAFILLAIKRFTWEHWLAGLAAGLVWLAVWFAPFSIWIGLLMVVLMTWGLIRTFRKKPA